MEQSIITFQANEQELVKTGGVDKFASSTVAYVEAHFELGTNWDSFDSVRAMWRFGSEVLATVLAIENGVGVCQVPHELLEKRGELKVNLVGSIVEDEVISDRLTTFPIVALIITKVAMVTSDETEVTPSQFEQFVAIVKDDADRAEDARDDAESAETSAEASATASASSATDSANSATASANSASASAESATQAQTAQTASETAQGLAEQAQASAESARDTAISAKNDAQASATASANSATASANSATASANAKTQAETAQAKAEQAQAKAEQAEQSILNLDATASVDATVGTPSVEVSVSEVGGNKVMDFDFHNLKGEQGIQGVQGETGNGIISTELISTVGAVKTYRQTYADGTHFDYVVTDGEVTEESLAETLESYAQIDGYYEDLTSGSTEEVISNVKTTDQEPYTFRTSGGNAEIGSREEDTLVGVSVAFNQLARPLVSGAGYWRYEGTATFQDNTVTEVWTPIYSQNGLRSQENPYTVNHKYFVTATIKNNGELTRKFYVGQPYGAKAYGDINGGATQVVSSILDVITTTGNGYEALAIGGVVSDIEYNMTASKFNLVDLTLAFGSDIANYLYTLEQAQAGEGVALAKKLGLNKYLSYNAGTLYSAQIDAHKMTGFNQWDEEWESGGIVSATGQNYVNANSIRSKNYIPVFPGATYYGKTPDKNVYFFAYDANKQFMPLIWSGYNTRTVKNSSFIIPEGAYYVRFNLEGTTYDNDICVSIHWDNSRDTDYEPYVLHNYPIDPVVLRGILKKDADGNIYADGDVYHNDGTVDRNWKEYVFDGSVDEYWTFQSINEHGIANFSFTIDKYENIVDSICNRFMLQNSSIANTTTEGYMLSANVYLYVRISSSKASTVSEFKTWLASNPITFVYKLAEPTTEQATPFTTPQIVDNWGTEEYPDYAVAQGDREYSVPMGHTTLYPISIRDKVEASADNPSNDGVYILQMSGGKATYIPLIIEDELPTAPTQDGSYVLKTVVSSGTATLSWVAE